MERPDCICLLLLGASIGILLYITRNQNWGLETETRVTFNSLSDDNNRGRLQCDCEITVCLSTLGSLKLTLRYMKAKFSKQEIALLSVCFTC